MNCLLQEPVGVARRSPPAPGCKGPQPLFLADWTEALFLHFEVHADRLQRLLPFRIDRWQGRAFISLVAFAMRRMRFARGGFLGAWLCRPIATHAFLNLRAYVRHAGEPGICFLSEWLPNRLSLLCGPALYALPYRHAGILYARDGGALHGEVSAREGAFSYRGHLPAKDWAGCEQGSLDEFLLERYIAFNAGHLLAGRRSILRSFRVWHDPWQQVSLEAKVTDDSLLRRTVPWWPETRFVGANYSPGVCDVRMSAPRCLPPMPP